MNTDLALMPGYRLVDYKIILNPHEDLRNRIIKLKKDISDKYGIPVNSSKPNITLVTFKVWELMEEKLINHLKVLAMGLPPVKIHLKDYGSYPSHLIYINIESKLVIQNLVKELRNAKRLMKSQDNDPYFIQDPYIPIAQRIPSEIFDKAYLEYNHKHFTASFIADNMLLLKKVQGDYGYQVLQYLQFMNLPVAVKQADLF